MTNTMQVVKRLKSTGEHLATYGAREAISRMWAEDAEQGILKFHDKIDVVLSLYESPFVEVGQYVYTMKEDT